MATWRALSLETLSVGVPYWVYDSVDRRYVRHPFEALILTKCGAATPSLSDCSLIRTKATVNWETISTESTPGKGTAVTVV